MGQTLNLVAAMLATARDLQAAGRNRAAIDLLQRLANFRNLAHDIAEEIHSRLADLHAELEQYKHARRHLTIALTFRPQHAGYHHRMGMWIESDPDAAVARAGRYYRQAVRSEPDNAEYWIDYGCYLLHADRMRSGRIALRRAFKLASHDAELVGRIAAALCGAGLWDDARRLLRLARFGSPRDSRFRTLWQQHQFERLCYDQQRESEERLEPNVEAPIVMPFVRRQRTSPTLRVEGKIIRFDSATRRLPQRNPQHPRRRRSN
jgi:Flp pilus assembly protein TadD